MLIGRGLRWKTCLATLSLACAMAAHAQVAVIVNPKSSATTLTAEQVSSLYLGKTFNLPGGLRQPLDLPEGSAVRGQFYDRVAGHNASQIKAIWARLMFSGKATPPRELATAADVKNWVASNPDAIGYIDKASMDGTVKAVLLLD